MQSNIFSLNFHVGHGIFYILATKREKSNRGIRVQDQNKDKRSTMFTVRNAENAMIVFTMCALALLVGVLLHELMIKGNGFVDSLYTVADNISKIMSASTMLTLFEEGIDIMFQRIRDTLKKERQLIAKAQDEVYQKVAEWDRRRKQAEERGETFTEPPPAAPEKQSKK